MEPIYTLEAINLEPDRPLIICDADEVLFMFVQAFERFLDGREHFLDLSSFALTGNVKSRATGASVDGAKVMALLNDFFEAETANMLPVPGAAEALAEAARFAQIVILSNLPAAHQAARSSCLKRNGMDYPLLVCAGPKGEPVAQLAARTRMRSLFIDDLPPHHESVARIAPEVIRLHMVADPRLRPLLGPAAHAHARHDEWTDALAFIRERLRP